ncbi:MAG: FxsA family protein [Pararhizobium sp.]
MPFSLVPFVLLGLPVAEIAVFIVVGRHIGVLPTLGLILLTAILGSILLRVQGFGVLARIRQDVENRRVPARELVHGLMILLAGVLLITPGFITDTLGFLLFIPPVRDAAWRLLKERIVVVTRFGGSRRGPAPEPPPASRPVIDLESGEFRRDPDAHSPWSDRR